MMKESNINWEAAASYWLDKESTEISMPKSELLGKIVSFVTSNKVCALATAGAGIVRNTPVEYFFYDAAFWIFSEGGLKFKALKANRCVCLAIFRNDPSFSTLLGLQVTGTAKIVPPFSSEYRHACEIRGIPVESLKKLSVPMNLIEVTPSRYDYLDSTLKKLGYSSRQHVDLLQ